MVGRVGRENSHIVNKTRKVSKVDYFRIEIFAKTGHPNQLFITQPTLGSRPMRRKILFQNVRIYASPARARYTAFAILLGIASAALRFTHDLAYIISNHGKRIIS